MSRNRKRQRENKKQKIKQELIDRYNAYGVKDLTPYEASKYIKTLHT